MMQWIYCALLAPYLRLLNSLRLYCYCSQYLLQAYALVQRLALILLLTMFLWPLIHIHTASAEDTFIGNVTDQITSGVGAMLEGLSNLTCETRAAFGVDGGKSSCTDDGGGIVANILSPGLYALAMARTTIDYDRDDLDSIPEAEKFRKALKGQCDRKADPDDPKLSFSFCNNLVLVPTLAISTLKMGANGVFAMMKGQDFFEAAAPYAPKIHQYSVLYEASVNETGLMNDLPLPIPWKVKQYQDRICVCVLGFTGYIPIGCKFIDEPFKSKYATSADKACNDLGTCYSRAKDNAKSPISLSGPVIQCVKEMVSRLVIGREVCDANMIYNMDSSADSAQIRSSSILYKFQEKMHSFVSVLLIIYVMSFGIYIALSGDVPKKGEVIGFILKLLLVTYFAVGINSEYVSDSGQAIMRFDGITSMIFPLLLSASTELAAWFSGSGPSGLCDFNDMQYPSELSHLRLWDTIDCKLSYYLGLNLFASLSSLVSLGSDAQAAGKAPLLGVVGGTAELFKDISISETIPPYLLMLIAILLAGQWQFVPLVLSYPILLISIAAFLVQVMATGIILIVILCIMAPIFVPMALFSYTQGYFKSWVQLLISTTIQPMVAAVFIAFVFNLYGYAFYGNCKYDHRDVALFNVAKYKNDVKAGLKVQESDYIVKTIRYFYVNDNWSDYTEQEAKTCKYSFGFFLSGLMSDSIESDDQQISMTSQEEGIFADTPKLNADQSMGFFTRMLVSLIILIIIKRLVDQLPGFMSDLSSSIGLGSALMAPDALNQKLASAVAARSGKDPRSKGDDSDKDNSVERSTDAASASGSGDSQDSVSTGGGDSHDSVSTGGQDKQSSDSVSTVNKSQQEGGDTGNIHQDKTEQDKNGQDKADAGDNKASGQDSSDKDNGDKANSSKANDEKNHNEASKNGNDDAARHNADEGQVERPALRSVSDYENKKEPGQ